MLATDTNTGHHRRALRRAVDITCEMVSPRSDDPIAARATDLSPFGLWVEAPCRLAVGERVVVCLHPPRTDSEVIAFAKVARVGASRTVDGVVGIGLELELAEEERAALAAALHGLPPPLPPVVLS